MGGSCDVPMVSATLVLSEPGCFDVAVAPFLHPKKLACVQIPSVNTTLQTSTPISLSILPDPHEEIVDQIAAGLGLARVGWIFTDLVPSKHEQGMRHAIYHFTYFFYFSLLLLAQLFSWWLG